MMKMMRGSRIADCKRSHLRALRALRACRRSNSPPCGSSICRLHQFEGGAAAFCKSFAYVPCQIGATCLRIGVVC